MSDIIRRLQQTLAGKAKERAIEYDGRWSSWGDVDRYGGALEGVLRDAGVPPNGRVALIVRNRGAHAAAIVGFLAHGRPLSFVYPFLPPAMLAEQIREIGASAVIADETDWPAIAGEVARTGQAGITLGAIGDSPRLAQPYGAGPALDHAQPADAAIDVLSSGTTGTPKRIAMPIHLLERAVQSAPGNEAGTTPPVQINIWPLGGVGGICILAAAAVHGTPLVLIERFSVDELVAAIRRHRPPMLGLSTTAIRMILDANVPPDAFQGVTSISGGAAHLDPDLQDEFERKYGVPIYWAMGATEFCGTIVRWTPQMREQVGNSKRGSVGLPTPGVRLRVVDPETGTELPAGHEGLLEVLCPAVRPDWVRTTDLAIIDADGYVFHRGRNDGAIVRGGFKILPERVAEALRKHPQVADAAVVGLTDDRLGMVPVAAVELVAGADELDEAALQNHVRRHLPPTHVPTRILIVDALPRTPSHKVRLAAVRELF